MGFGPHPNVLPMIAGQRRVDMHAQADHLRLVKLAQTNTDRRHPWSDVPALRAVAMVLAPPLTALHRG